MRTPGVIGMDANGQVLRLGAAAVRLGLNTFVLAFAVGVAVLLYQAYAAQGDLCVASFVEPKFWQSQLWIIAAAVSLAVACAMILLGAALVMRSPSRWRGNKVVQGWPVTVHKPVRQQ
jgi:ABC-type sugar transport system permease subunit